MAEVLLTTVAPAFARLFDEPDDAWRTDLASVSRLLQQDAPEAARALAQFAEVSAADPLEVLRERHAATFDLAPVCVPYVSVHLFGDESFKRARLMGGLADSYRRTGFDPGSELPDHIATILRHVPNMPVDEQHDLLEFVLRPAAAAMANAFDGSANPYRLVVDALQHVLAACSAVEASEASEAAHA